MTDQAPAPIRQKIAALGFDEVELFTEGDESVGYAGYRITHAGTLHERKFIYLHEDMEAGAWKLVGETAELLAESLGLLVREEVAE